MKKIGEVSIIEKDKKVMEVAAMHMKKYFPIESVILFGSKAIGKAINQGAEQLLPKLYPYLQQLQTSSFPDTSSLITNAKE